MLNTHSFPNIADIDFSWFHESSHKCTALRNGETFRSANGNEA